MSLNTVVIVCTQALIIQSISAQCIGGFGAYDGYGLGRYGDCGAFGYGPASLAASHGPGLAVTSASPIIPAGVSVVSENGYEGALAVGGAVPFLGTVALEGALPTIGAGAIAYGCGSGAVTITTEDLAAYGYVGIGEPFGYGYGFAGPFGYGAGYGGFPDRLGFGCGRGRPFGFGAGYGYGGYY